MKLIIASNNAYKVREINEILGAFFPVIQSLRQAGISFEAVEDGTTFSENAIIKAEQTLCQAPGFDAALADDSGIVVDALDGAPGVYSARYAGEDCDDNRNNAKLLHAMQDVPYEKRTCQFVSAIALARKGQETICVSGTVKGMLLNAPRGEGGFGYDPLFYYEPLQKSFAEMTAVEKNQVSHRKKGLAALKEVLETE